jgi:hypothetical protein
MGVSSAHYQLILSSLLATRPFHGIGLWRRYDRGHILYPKSLESFNCLFTQSFYWHVPGAAKDDDANRKNLLEVTAYKLQQCIPDPLGQAVAVMVVANTLVGNHVVQ